MIRPRHILPMAADVLILSFMIRKIKRKGFKIYNKWSAV